MKRSILAIGIIFLFITLIVSSIVFGYNINTSVTNNDGNILYVGGSGPGNYTKIQDAINNASDGIRFMCIKERIQIM